MSKLNKIPTPIEQLEEGLILLQEFLQEEHFILQEIDQEIASHPESNFSWAIYVTGQKSIQFYFKYHLYNISYRFKEKHIDHHTYFYILGQANKNKFPGFQDQNILTGFKNALIDFAFLKNDFFCNYPSILDSYNQSKLCELMLQLNTERIRGNFKW